MKILHVTPHLGGGVGKAHAAITSALGGEVEQTFVLLEEARDRRFVAMIEAAGAPVGTARGLDNVADLAAGADIVQFEFWNHPRLFECLARTPFPPMRTVFWSHISGLFRPVIQPGLIGQAGRFVFTTEASYAALPLATMTEVRKRIAVINSGFGFADVPKWSPQRAQKPVIAYLGTVDFIKMHPGFFDAIDRLEGPDIHVSIWGDPASASLARAKAMHHPERIQFRGQTAEPASALAAADIFFYPLQRDHYGTSENALVEAMSLGLVPVVLDNPAELAIVRDRETGFVARSIEECTGLLQMLTASPDLLQEISRYAIRHVAETRTPERSARNFTDLWRGLLGEPVRRADFRTVIGDSPESWFLATQCLPGETWRLPEPDNSEKPSKGALAHFEHVFPDDASLSRLAGARSKAL